MSDVELILPGILEGEDKSSAFKNRIRKNYRHFRKWAKRTGTDCFRIYDREIHEYPLAIDLYAGRFCVHYFSGKHDDGEPPESVIDEVTEVLLSVFGGDAESIYWRTRIRREKRQQYQKAGETKEFFTVFENGVKFRVNLLDYLDTGIFLDHRETRKIVAQASVGKRLLNLFAYTCSFSVHAAIAGATYTKSVDMSNTYTDWGRENFLLNGLPLTQNEIVRADCMRFVDEEIRTGKKYDVVIIDPPTISRSKKMDEMFDVQRDFVFLISKSLRLLDKGGIIFFSTNSRKFVFGDITFQRCTIEEISYKTLPLDFHDPKIHRCWKIVSQSSD